jgi:Transcriptional Coactivator p15 (PC4)
MKKPASLALAGINSVTSTSSNHLPELSRPAQGRLTQPIEIAKFWRNRYRRESVVLRLREYEANPLVDLRVFNTGSDGIERPTKLGVCLSITRLPALADAFASAYREAVRQGLLGGSSSMSQSGG